MEVFCCKVLILYVNFTMMSLKRGYAKLKVYTVNLIYLFLDRGEGKGEGENHQCVVASHTPPTGDLAYNPGLCPDWESNQQSFGSAGWCSIH